MISNPRLWQSKAKWTWVANLDLKGGPIAIPNMLASNDVTKTINLVDGLEPRLGVRLSNKKF